MFVCQAGLGLLKSGMTVNLFRSYVLKPCLVLPQEPVSLDS